MQKKRILIRAPNWVGDAVLAIPAMKAVRAHFSGAEVTVLARPWVAGLFTSATFIDCVWSEPKPAGLVEWARIVSSIRRRRFDIAVLFPNSFESAFTTFAGGVPQRVGYATDGRRWMLTNAVTPTGGCQHQVHYYLDLVKALAVNAAQASIAISATPEERQAARKLLAAEGILHGAPFLVLNAGAAYGSAKRWNDDRFALAADPLST